MFRLLVVAMVSAALATAAYADLLQTGGTRWVVLASTRDLDNAIGIASLYKHRFDDVRVAESSNGWLAVIAGPVSIARGAKAARAELWSAGGFPDDLFLSNGRSFTRTVWNSPKDPAIPTWSYKGGQPLIFTAGGMDIEVSHLAEGNIRYPTITLRKAGLVLVREVLKGSESFAENMNAEVRIAWFDRTAAEPQIIFSSYWNGAHCCTVSKILTNRGNGWASIEGATLDGGGYQLQDIDGDGSVELLSADNAFLYAFAPYVFSSAPLVISKLDGDRLIDMRWNFDFRRYYRRELFGWEYRAKLEPELWRRNGFLSAWLALKSILGESDQAWTVVLENYDRSSDWPSTICDASLRDGACPEEATRQVSFPEALRDHLTRNGYLGPQVAKTEETSKSPEQTSPARDNTSTPVPPEKSTFSAGTGFFVSSQGHLVTNHHVIKGCSAIEVRRPGLLALPANIVAVDPTNDLALLRVASDKGGYAPVRVETRLGESVAVFGYPLSQVLASGGNFTLGNVTALAGLGNDTRFIQISAPVQQGNSGGPLLDSYGNVIGVVTSKLDAVAALAVTGDIPQNVNFALRGASLYAFLLSYGISPVVRSSAKN
ncbi:S1C family serine protease [Rhizobium giardinii]|uniref:S1-C subfamily serine protease n=1 Tax=Rhizobium giardinii TaxID=56731 RepID=A0A7W8XAB1_9HYPH|nr:serine protease [Rhizobium giardinii]MBB5536493.1 S1-C subfamily serine protease [Rhizobium giardinii]